MQPLLPTPGRWPRVLLGALVLAGASAAQATDVVKQQLEFFENKIRPVLMDKCYRCHSGTGDKVKGGLTVDTKEGLLRGGDTGPSIVPGSPEKSLLVRAVSYADENLQMPPKEKLASHEIADLVVWIKMGAPYPQSTGTTAGKGYGNAKAASHWAFQPVKKPAVPTVQQRSWVANDIDAFILAKLEEKGMHPSKEADKRALLRRATYDLTGLPPTTEEVKAFLADDSPQAFARVVDRLLASPHYGERWGRFWLDVARYADTKGEVNGQREDFRYPYAYTYRDYVIRAFNEDKPYDQFILEQIAADRLKGGDPSSLAALGFLTLGNRFDNNANEIINDRIDTVTKGFQALTVACARCHDHMFDPVPTEDYYSLHGIFASSTEPREKPLLAEVRKSPEYADYQRELAKREADLQAFYRDDVGKFLGDFRLRSAAYLTILDEVKGKDRSELGGYVRKNKLDQDIARLWQTVLTRTRRGYDPILGPYHEFARLTDKEFPAQARQIAARVAANTDKKRPVNPLIAREFRGITPTSMAHVAAIYGRALAATEQRWQDTLARNPRADKLPDPYQEALRLLPFAGGRPNEDPIESIRRILPRNLQARETRLKSTISQLEMTHPGAPERAMALVDAPNPRDSYVFLRGEANSRGNVVPRRYLEVLSPQREAFRDGSGRLELARAIASRDNPLTARVLVNRVWMHHFGEGFVLTPDDFGTQSSPPSHPELIDHLATTFMDNGWSVKKLHRQIMLSNTYRQSSENNPQFAQIDPYNRLLWRANIRRLEFEALRDSLLALGGKLDRTLGGKPVDLTTVPYSNRRTVYGYIDRAKVPEVMNNFDFASPDITTGKRYETIVPQQALFMMNSPLVIELARSLVERPDFKGLSDDADRVKLLYEVIYQRAPTETEVKLGLTFLNTTPEKDLIPIVATAGTVAPPTTPKAKGKGKQAPAAGRPAAPVERKPLAAWEKYAHALLQANEATFVN